MARCYSHQALSAACIRGTGFPQPLLTNWRITYPLTYMFGHQLLLPIPDIDRTNFFLILGANPAVSNGSLMTAPGMSRRLQEIRERGGKVILIDPRFNETARLVDRHLFIKPGHRRVIAAGAATCCF